MGKDPPCPEMTKEQTPQNSPVIEKSSSNLSNMGQPNGRPRVQLRYVDTPLPPQGGSTGTTLCNVELCSGLNQQVKANHPPSRSCAKKKSCKKQESQPRNQKISELMQRFIEKRSTPQPFREVEKMSSPKNTQRLKNLPNLQHKSLKPKLKKINFEKDTIRKI